jgi:hypothetical protein
MPFQQIATEPARRAAPEAVEAPRSARFRLDPPTRSETIDIKEKLDRLDGFDGKHRAQTAHP